MPKWAKVVISAGLNAAITAGTAVLTLLNELPEGSTMSTVGQVSWAIVAIGAGINFAKDVQAYLANPPE